MAEILEIEGYSVSMLQSHPSTFAMIMLFARERPGVWYRIFFNRGETEPSQQPSGAGLIIYNPRSAYEATLDLLRNEKPIYLHTYGTGCALRTSKEPVGEGELDP